MKTTLGPNLLIQLAKAYGTDEIAKAYGLAEHEVYNALAKAKGQTSARVENNTGKRQQRKWTFAEEQELIRLWNSPIRDKEIAYRLCRHRGVIRRKAMQLGCHSSRMFGRQNSNLKAPVLASN